MIRIRLIGDYTPDIDFASIGCELVHSGEYDILLSSFRDNTTSVVACNNSLAMVLFPEKVPVEDSEGFIRRRTKSAKAVMVEGDYQFYRQLYRYRESVFWCYRDEGKYNRIYKEMFDWLLWEKNISHLSLEEYTEQLKKEGICQTHCVNDIGGLTPQFCGDKDWKTKLQMLDSIPFTGFDPGIVKVNISDLEAKKVSNEKEIAIFMADTREFPKAINNAPSWKYLFHAIAKNGVANPVWIYKYKNGRMLLTKGKHRYIAAKRLGCKTLPAIIAHEV